MSDTESYKSLIHTIFCTQTPCESELQRGGKVGVKNCIKFLLMITSMISGNHTTTAALNCLSICLIRTFTHGILEEEQAKTSTELLYHNKHARRNGILQCIHVESREIAVKRDYGALMLLLDRNHGVGGIPRRNSKSL